MEDNKLLVEWLIELGASVEAGDGNVSESDFQVIIFDPFIVVLQTGDTLLIRASQIGSSTMTGLLLNHGADIHARNKVNFLNYYFY